MRVVAMRIQPGRIVKLGRRGTIEVCLDDDGDIKKKRPSSVRQATRTRCERAVLMTRHTKKDDSLLTIR